ncbi:hypothetical protein D7Z94_16795 [Ulvibacterium marinum]|uniref:Uncharacterized protein n=1 Tax=Ulvibacterium marinum TaxID=2419782 RepID=A0A3B0C3L2_9FLAO|nr:hypothetical protein D7Z94_16795 [Ulvibacterium marinum]
MAKPDPWFAHMIELVIFNIKTDNEKTWNNKYYNYLTKQAMFLAYFVFTFWSIFFATAAGFFAVAW